MDSPYRQMAAKAIASPQLQKNLADMQQRLGKGAMDYWKSMADPTKRQRVKDSRMQSFARLDLILAELTDKIRNRGGHVHFAVTAADAVDHCLAVARRHRVQRVVKGKSMMSLEIGLDPALEKEGIEVVETDLGEYIVQLGKEPPSHIIAPCIHKNRQEIGELFQSRLGIDYSDDPETLTKAARKALRDKMLTADMGITGCNLACAESGQICLVSNEGNIRMTTTMPPVHIAILGMERVVATVEEELETLQLLTMGAALQKLSTYVTFLGGPAADHDPDGPREFHLIIVDNGRSKILADPEFREVLACIRCGACLNICPVYGKIGGHAYNAPYSGPIGAVISPLLDDVNRHADLCKGESLCGACKDICPVENDLPRMLLALRRLLAYGNDNWQTRQANPAEAMGFSLWGTLVTRPALYRRATRLLRLLQRPFVNRQKQTVKLFGLATGWTASRDLPPLAERSFGEIWNAKPANRQTKRQGTKSQP